MDNITKRVNIDAEEKKSIRYWGLRWSQHYKFGEEGLAKKTNKGRVSEVIEMVSWKSSQKWLLKGQVR